MKQISLLIAFTLVIQLGCAQENLPMIETPTETNYSYEVVVDGLEIPWGMAFISTEELLITEKSGTLYRVKEGQKQLSMDFQKCIHEVREDFWMWHFIPIFQKTRSSI